MFKPALPGRASSGAENAGPPQHCPAAGTPPVARPVGGECAPPESCSQGGVQEGGAHSAAKRGECRASSWATLPRPLSAGRRHTSCEPRPESVRGPALQPPVTIRLRLAQQTRRRSLRARGRAWVHWQLPTSWSKSSSLSGSYSLEKKGWCQPSPHHHHPTAPARCFVSLTLNGSRVSQKCHLAGADHCAICEAAAPTNPFVLRLWHLPAPSQPFFCLPSSSKSKCSVGKDPVSVCTGIRPALSCLAYGLDLRTFWPTFDCQPNWSPATGQTPLTLSQA